MSSYASTSPALFLLSFLSSCSSENFVKDLSNPDLNHLVGRGYSTDKRKLAQSHCFNARIIGKSEFSSEIKISDSSNFTELKKTLNAEANIKGSYNLVEVEAALNYMSSQYENEFTLTVNYFAIIHRDVTLHVDGDHVKALTPLGKGIYEKNPQDFGIACGDQFISGYREGATLILGLHITMTTKEEKENLEAKLKGKYASIVEASGSLAKEFEATHNNDLMTISARQKGGDAAEISAIIGETGTTCSLNNMAKCREIARRLEAYTSDFIRQVKVGDKKVVLHTTHQSIDDLGLESKSTRIALSKPIDQYRIDLERWLHEFKEIIRKLKIFLADYPVKRDANLEEQAQRVLKNAEVNVGILTAKDGGIEECYNRPKSCEEHYNIIKSQLIDIKLSRDIKNFNKLKNVIVWDYGMFYHTGGETPGSWLYDTKNRAVEITVHYQTEKEFRFQVHIGDTESWTYHYIWNAKSHTYTCDKCKTLKCELKLQASAFYFDDSDVLKQINAVYE